MSQTAYSGYWRVGQVPSVCMPGRRQWRKAPDFPDRSGRFDDVNDTYLDSVESDLEGFGETGQRGFSDAWQDAPVGLDEAAAAFATDETDTRGRDLDARSGRWKVALFLAVSLAAAGGYAYSQGLFDDGSASAAAEAEAPTLIAPDVPRTFDDEPTRISPALAARGDAMFSRSTAGADPQPLDGEASLVQAFTASPVLWAGRTHVALTGPGVGNDELCLVVTLVSIDLRTIDLAATGACAEELGVTGDRVACAGRQAMLLEVWPFDPRAANRPPPVAAVRFRVETAEPDGSVLSQRGTVVLPEVIDDAALVAASSVLGGAPGDVVTIAGQQCTLVDRSDLVIQLLPS